MHDGFRDLRYGVRALRRAPGLTLVSGITLALSIGAATTVFSVVNAVLVKPLPYPDAAALVSIWNTSPATDGAGQVPLSATQYFTYRDENRVFAAVGLWATRTATVTALAEPEEVRTLRVTHDTLEALGVRPAIGRWFSRADDAPGAPETVMLAYAYWQRRFGGDTSVVGRTLTLDARPRTVIGVMPAGFRFLNETADVIVPFQLDPSSLLLGAFNYFAVARLAPGTTMEHASADLVRMTRIWLHAWPSPPGFDRESFARVPVLRTLKEHVVGDIGGVLRVMMGMVALVMLVACANVATLLLVRAEQRRHDVAVRVALGAGWPRLVRESFVESGLLGLLGGALGVGLAFAALEVLVAAGPASLPRLDEIGLDPVAVVFATLVALLSSAMFGVIPILRYLGPRIVPSLRVAGRTSSASRAQLRIRNVLVVAQVSLALVLLVGAGLMVRTLSALRGVNPGFATSAEIQLARITIPETLVDYPERVFQVQREILDRVAAVPGVTRASLASAAPMEPFVSANTVLAEHHSDAEGTTRRFKFIMPGYFDAVGTPVVAGRDLTWTDLDQRRPVVVISENMAREIWRDPAAAVGRRIRENPDGPWREIIGVVGNVFDDGVHTRPPAIAYWPALSENFEGDPIRVRRSMTLVIRSRRAGSEAFLNEVQRSVWAVNANLPLSRVQTLKAIYDASLARTAFTLVTLAIAAAMALLLGVVGVYGVIAYAVAQRTREIGIRLALGAPAGEVRRLFVRQGVALAGIGVVGGTLIAIALTRLMSSLVFGISTLDAATYLAVSLLVMAAAAMASFIPAQRAISVDPVDALRSQS